MNRAPERLPAPPADIQKRTVEICANHAGLEGPLLTILHGVHREFGYLPDAAIRVIASELNQTAAEIHGVASFYHDFRTEPAGRHTLKICRAEACQAVGGNDLAAAAQDRLGLDWHGTTADGAVTLEPVYCLGLCACGPAAMYDGAVIGRVDTAKLDRVLKDART